MEYKEITLKIPKEASELIDVSMKLLEEVRKAGADGFGVDDIPTLMAAVMQVAGEATDYSLIVEELKSDPEAAANLALITGTKLLKALGLV